MRLQPHARIHHLLPHLAHVCRMRECQMRPIYMAKETYIYGKRGLRDAWVSNETYIYGKRDLYIWQKRPVYMAEEAYIHGKRPVYMAKEAYMCGKRDLSYGKRDLLVQSYLRYA